MKKCGLVLLTLVAGLAGLALRFWRFGFQLEPAGLLESGSPAAIALLVWTVIGAAGILLLTRKEAPRAYNVGALGRIGQAVLCVYLIFTGVWTILNGAATLELVVAVIGLAAALFGLGVIAGWKGNHLLLCLYTVVLLISRFRVWSTDPQLENYCFQLLACVSLMLAAYHRAAFDLELGTMKAYRRWSLLGGFFCLMSLVDTERVFFAVAAFWLLTNQLLGEAEAASEEA